LLIRCQDPFADCAALITLLTGSEKVEPVPFARVIFTMPRLLSTVIVASNLDPGEPIDPGEPSTFHGRDAKADKLSGR